MSDDAYEWAIIFEPDEGTLMGEPVWAVKAAEAAGVIYLCPIEDGSCSNGHHKGGCFWHYCEGKTPDDYDAATDNP